MVHPCLRLQGTGGLKDELMAMVFDGCTMLYQGTTASVVVGLCEQMEHKLRAESI